MHKSSYEAMKKFRDDYLCLISDDYLCLISGLSVLDVGSMDVNGSYRNLFKDYFNYTGLDISPGPNVDVVGFPGCWPIAKESYDVVVSGQCMEHVQNLHAWIKEVARVLKTGGLACLIAPWTFKQHRYPVDCWRILPDGMRYLMKEVAGLSVLECYVYDVNTVGIGRKL